MHKRSKGITLIALVITMIVMCFGMELEQHIEHRDIYIQ